MSGSSSKSWGFNLNNSKPIYVVLFVSRNKDNKDIPNFTERRMSFITTYEYNSDILNKKFIHFCEDGVKGEFCRFYYSVNSRNPEIIYKKLLHFLIDEPNFNICSLSPKVAGIAAKEECRLEKKWLFDFDINDIEKVKEFVNDILTYNNKDINVTYRKTPNGYAIITNKGFDTRELFNKWTEGVSLNRDGLLCVHWFFGINPEYRHLIS